MTLNSLHREQKIDEKIAKKFNEGNNIYNFRFLLLNPCSTALHERGKIENKDENLLRMECAKSIKNLERIRKLVDIKTQHGKGIFEYGFYDITPSHGLILTDKTGWVGPFLYHKSGTTTKWFQINNYQAYTQYDNEFEAIWSMKNKDTEDPETHEKKRICFSKEELIKFYPKTENIFLISKYISLDVFDDVILQQKRISNGKYDELVVIANTIKNSPVQITDDNFETINDNRFVLKIGTTKYTVDFSESDRITDNP
jgi:hypothetical protein